jgi:hypothetical protein
VDGEHDPDVELLIKECESELRKLSGRGAPRDASPEAFRRLAELIEARLRTRLGKPEPDDIGA